MSEDHSVMRTTLLGSLLDCARRNRSRGFADVRLFEYGAVYLPRGAADAGVPTGNPWYPVPDPELPVERTHLAALLTGRLRPAAGATASRRAPDFFAAKGVLEALLDALRDRLALEAAPTEPFLHPRRGATVLVGGDAPAGWLGELHPSVAAQWDLEERRRVRARPRRARRDGGAVPRYEDLTRFPAVRQDLAVVVAEDVPAARVLERGPRRRRRAAARGATSSTSTAARRSARGASRSRCGSSSARRTAR